MQAKWPIIYLFSDDIGLRSPVIQKTFRKKKNRYFNTSIVKCFFFLFGAGGLSKIVQTPYSCFTAR